ncbi:MAG TPA: DNA gyrase subunit A, partial [Chloroflexi bacterium]|nr:DNA gyrase subunit A [Chloroflexota bacterium]
NVLVTMTNRGYVKRIPDGVYRTQRRGGRGVTGVTMREADGVQHLVAANTHDSLLFFTNRGRVFQLKVYDLPDVGRMAKGMAVVNLLSLQPNESITTLLPVRDFKEAEYLFFCTRNGRIKRTALDQFSAVRSTGLIAITLDDDDELAWVRMTSGNDDIILVTEQAKAIRFDEGDARAMGRPAAGVIGIRLGVSDRVMAAIVIDDIAAGNDLLLVSENGFGKRTAVSEFNVQHRGGQGVTAMRLTTRNGKLASAELVTPDQEVMLMSNDGIVIRTRVEQISRYGRQTQGVAVMRLGNGDRVVSMTVLSEQSEEADALVDTLAEIDKEERAPKSNGRTPKTPKASR